MADALVGRLGTFLGVLNMNLQVFFCFVVRFWVCLVFLVFGFGGNERIGCFFFFGYVSAHELPEV